MKMGLTRANIINFAQEALHWQITAKDINSTESRSQINWGKLRKVLKPL